MLEREGYSVALFIDQNAENLRSSSSYIIVPLSDAQFDERSIVLLCLQNVLQHSKVANLLYDLGVSKVLCLSAGQLLNDQNTRIMMQKYRALLAYKFDDLTDIPVLTQNPIVCIPAAYILEEKMDTVTWLAPVELLYTRNLQDSSDNAENLNQLAKLQVSDQCIMVCKPYQELFAYFEKSSCLPSIYLDIYAGNDPSARENLLADRALLNQKFLQELEKAGLDYFIASAPDGCLTEKAKIVIRDGIHRISFLIHKGFLRVPIRTSATDFYKFIAMPKCEKIIKNVHDGLCFQYFEHPFAYDLELNPDRHAASIFRALASILIESKIHFSNFHFAELSNYIGYLSRNLLRIGIRSATYISSASSLRQASLINELFGIEMVLVDSLRATDIMFLQIPSDYSNDAFLKKQLPFVRHIIFLEYPMSIKFSHLRHLIPANWKMFEKQVVKHGYKMVNLAAFCAPKFKK